MPDRFVRRIGYVVDVHGVNLDVGVDYDAVTIAGHRLEREECKMFASKLVDAIWEAADNARLMAEEAAG